MASQLKVILAFSLPSGGSQSLPHGLNWNGTPVVPDHIEAQQGGFEITADDTNITVTGVGTVLVLAESWHTIEREFGGVQNTNLVPQPFVLTGGGAGSIPTPPFNLATVTIYARTTGSDITGNGSLANPYATFQRAIRDVPLTPAPGASYIVDVTGIGVEVFPQQYCLPQIAFPTLAYENDTTIPYFYSGAGLRVRALPQLASTLVNPADAVIGAADAATVAGDANTNLVTLTLGSPPRAGWTPANLIGKQVIRTVGSTTPTTYSANCVIYGVVGGNQLLLTTDLTSFNGGPGPALSLAPSEQLQIVEPSATFQTDPNYFPIDIANDSFAGFVSTVNSIAFQGIDFAPPTSTEGGALGLLNCPQVPLELCVLGGIDGQGQAGAYWVYLNGCVLTNIVASANCSMFMAGCFLDSVPLFYMANATPQSFFDCVFSGCGSYATVSQNGLFIESNTAFQNCLIENSVPTFYAPNGDAIYLAAGRVALTNVEIDGAQGNAIFIERGTNYAALNHVTGSGNGAGGTGYGLNANDGAQVQVTDAGTSTVKGVSGEILCGALATRTWANFYGVAPIGQQYDITAVSAAGAVGTGTRVFQRA